MNELTVIEERMVLGKEFRIYGDFENPLFLAKDVSNWIEHSNARMMLKGVDEAEKVCVNNPYALKGQQEQWFLTEDGLYEVLMQSRKPIAKEFKKQVKTILKSIRKNGGYIANQEDLLPEESQDFVAVGQKCPIANGEYQERVGHALKIDTAKEISMLQRNDKGKELSVRASNWLYSAYAIDCKVKIFKRIYDANMML